ncbi:putative Mg2+ transporter-C (MgtC) family protein [Pseudomonas sp. SLBN-26]|uniref:MgtC/SapB family protein n=1 Tax=Pseudomonadaceae TaxID=135621 RepID=UPI001152F3A6|nr:MgtC/SapB family protein [Pseudomonas sp. SLBN-26]MCP1616666.1 putative Mg2+ transporter-C (MgtC) family protein [Pseudomonas otitidis]TQL05921.1 putative Mg2+ transporter-C (MgtC) family protein [Pseudomonas sp. SLBN-26]
MSAWERVLETLAEEFADLEDPARATRVVLRLFLAALLGGLLGFEREQHGKAAGVRTHMLVALGAALFVLVPQMAGAEHDAMSRVIQGLTAGIGFLCTGTILKRDRMDEVKGLTTAAGLWSTTAIGVTVGLGFEATALLAALVIVAILNLLPHVLGSFDRPQR